MKRQIFQRIVILLAVLLISTPPVGAGTNQPGPHMDRQVVVKLASGQPLFAILADYQAHELDELPGENVYLIRLDGMARDLVQVLVEMAGDRRIVWAEHNFVSRVPEADPYEIGAWGGYDPTPYYNQYAQDAVNLPWAQEMWQGQGIVVAVIDTGAQLDHPALAGHILPASWDFIDDDNLPEDTGNGVDDDEDGQIDNAFGHGTHVAGIVNLAAPEADLLILRVLDDEGNGHMFDVSRAILYAVDHGADVINLSLGTNSSPEALEMPLQRAFQAGVVVVAAAGNQDSTAPEFPAALPGVIGVAALDETLHKAEFSSYGEWVDVAAPGVAITSTYPISGYGVWSGTSMATPFVAGQVALIREAAPDLTTWEVISQVLESATNVDALNPDYAGLLGRGQMDALRSVGCYWADLSPDPAHNLTSHTCDYEVNLLDIMSVAGAWGQPVSDGRDVNDDGTVDLADILAVAERWGWKL